MTETPQQPSRGSSIGGVLGDIARYFRDFLESDFHKKRLPKRQVNRMDRAGNLVGINLSRYPTLTNAISRQLGKPVEEGFRVTFSRGKHKAELDTRLKDLIDKHVQSIPADDILRMAEHGKSLARTALASHKDDRERAHGMVMSDLERNTVEQLVKPLLGYLEKHLNDTALNSLDNIFDIKDELGQRLVAGNEDPIAYAMNTAMINGDYDEYDQIIDDIFNPQSLLLKITDYFSSYTATDFFTELHQLGSTIKIRENMEVYLYIGELHYNNVTYPLCFVPLHVSLQEGLYELTADPHVYIYKNGLDYVFQRIEEAQGRRTAASLVKDRIVYLETGQSYRGVIQNLFDGWTQELGLKVPLDLSAPQLQHAKSSLVVMTNRLHISAFERSDESMLNDYEALLTSQEGGEDVAQDFESLVDQILFGNPVSVTPHVSAEWVKTAIPDRLVAKSPVPVNEEQRQILSAIRREDTYVVVISGPPGCGKSHTITAISFEQILNGGNCLILSDKIEALDVVEGMIGRVLDRIRHDDDFINPILRIGRKTNNYSQIVKGQTMARLQHQVLAAKEHEEQFTSEIEHKETDLKDSLGATIKAYEKVDMSDLVDYLAEESQTGYKEDVLDQFFNDTTTVKLVQSIQRVIEFLQLHDGAYWTIIKAGAEHSPRLDDVRSLLGLQPGLNEMRSPSSSERKCLELFGHFKPRHLNIIGDYIAQYEKLDWPLFGYFFTRAKVQTLNEEVIQNLDLLTHHNLEHRVLDMSQAQNVMLRLNNVICVPSDAPVHPLLNLGFHQLCQGTAPIEESVCSNIRSAIEYIHQHLAANELLGNTLELTGFIEDLNELTDKNNPLRQDFDEIRDLMSQYKKHARQLANSEKTDYLQERTELEIMHTRSLANILDERAVDFYNNHRNDAMTLKRIISRKEKFPTDSFETMKNAFPIIISNIRDFAAMIPLQAGLFDLVIIDEASQVSIAQAFPAILRAKKLVVLGDKKQFSNVKSAHASNQTNQKYLNEIRQRFTDSNGHDALGLERLRMFDIKTSVLDFADRIANFSIVLSKHFRGYAENISFSSRYFYDNQLQSVKIRGKPIQDVLQFVPVEHDGKISVYGNANELEADAIMQRIKGYLEQDDPPSVCVITPFTDQQKYLSQLVNEDADADAMYEKLDLRVFTFDTCQGQERDVVIYSFVDSPNHRRLNHVFPRELKGSGEVEENLRLQRLNVGFSRARECMIFYHSLPIEQYTNAFGEALRHYQKVIETASQVDPNVELESPMEKKLLHWLQNTAFYQEHHEQIEIIPQFPIGDYLKQIDPHYEHPKYRVDFLLRFREEDRVVTIIIEYDGFAYHFDPDADVDLSNYEHYLTDKDLEREKVLEGYGYKILRVNRFNLGKDPVQRLSQRLKAFVQSSLQDVAATGHAKGIADTAADLESKQSKVCRKCNQIRPIEDFEDPSTVSGMRRTCRHCRGK